MSRRRFTDERQRLEPERTKILEEKRRCEKDLQKQQQLDQRKNEAEAQLKSEKKKIEDRKRELEKKERKAELSTDINEFYLHQLEDRTLHLRTRLRRARGEPYSPLKVKLLVVNNLDGGYIRSADSRNGSVVRLLVQTPKEVETPPSLPPDRISTSNKLPEVEIPRPPKIEVEIPLRNRRRFKSLHHQDQRPTELTVPPHQ